MSSNNKNRLNVTRLSAPRKALVQTGIIVLMICVAMPAHAQFGENNLSAMEQLGKQIFFDHDLSQPRGMACATCHDPETGFTSGSSIVGRFEAIERGTIERRAGNRRPPTAAYAALSDDFSLASSSGGTFWDGRATGEAVTADIFPEAWPDTVKAANEAILGPTVDQAMLPFLNDVEQNLPNARVLCIRVMNAYYAWLWRAAWGEPIRCGTAKEVELNHKRIAFAIGAWESSVELVSFSSFRDDAIRDELETYGVATFPLDMFNAAQNEGHDLFYSRQNSCARFCHSSSFRADGTDLDELYVAADAGYFNIGFPANPFNPFYAMDRVRNDSGEKINPLGIEWRDPGLGGRTDSDFSDHIGEFKVPTMRNIDKRPRPGFTRAYGHNGYFKSLETVINFYNTRDMKPVCRNHLGETERFVTDTAAMHRGCWPEPEIMSPNIFDCDAGEFCKVVLEGAETFETYCEDPNNRRDIGNLCLTPDEEAALVEYLKTLNDTIEIGYLL